MINEYFTLAGNALTEIDEKKSRFLCSAGPVESEEAALAFLERVKAANRGAAHHVFAYSTGIDDLSQRYSDDGEPSGSAGMPVMEVLNKLKLRNSVLVVTRYFGGILLGAAGLVRAYSKAAVAGTQAAGILRMALCENLKVTVTYPMISKTANYFRIKKIMPESVEYTDGTIFHVAVESGGEENFKIEMRDLCGSEVSFESLGKSFAAMDSKKFAEHQFDDNDHR